RVRYLLCLRTPHRILRTLLLRDLLRLPLRRRQKVLRRLVFADRSVRSAIQCSDFRLCRCLILLRNKAQEEQQSGAGLSKSRKKTLSGLDLRNIVRPLRLWSMSRWSLPVSTTSLTLSHILAGTLSLEIRKVTRLRKLRIG